MFNEIASPLEIVIIQKPSSNEEPIFKTTFRAATIYPIFAEYQLSIDARYNNIDYPTTRSGFYLLGANFFYVNNLKFFFKS
jgi:hypothetical protein